jgi:hypothetical protein
MRASTHFVSIKRVASFEAILYTVPFTVCLKYSMIAQVLASEKRHFVFFIENHTHDKNIFCV